MIVGGIVNGIGGRMREPLPLAPRPLPGEAISSWAARIAARYDLSATELDACLPGSRAGGAGHGTMRWLDHRADPGLEAALAAAAQIAPERLRALRIVPDDGSTSCWHREGVAWCPACVQDDVARWGETYERATWRLGCCVLCPDHGVLLKDQCRRCYPASRAHFWHAGGRMTLICVQCRRLPDPPEGEDTDADDSWFLPFDLMATPELNRAVAILQADLSAALAGATSRPGCFVRSAGGLMDAVACLVAGIALGREMRFEPRVDLFTRAPSKPWAVVYELFTPAAASVYCAFGLLAIVAAVLDSLDGQGGASYRWKQSGVAPVITAVSYMAWLNDEARQWLRSASRHWEPPLQKAFWAAAEGRTGNWY